MLSIRNASLEFLLNEPYKVGHAVGFTDLTELHNEWLRKMLLSEDDMTLLAHRGSYKTTTLSLFLALHTIMFPQETVTFFRKTDTDTAEVIAQAKKILREDCMQMLCRNIWNTELSITTDTNACIDTNLHKGVQGQSQITAYGIGSSITGKHSDIVVTDDIVNKKDRESGAERRRTCTAYMELENIKNRGGRFINTGTPWHKEDAISTLMPNVVKYDWKSTGLMTREEAEALRQSMTPSLFSANYELVHIADEEALFSTPKFFTGDHILYDSIAHVDAAYGTSGDATAFTIGRQIDGKYYMLGKRWQKHVDDCLEEMFFLMDKFRAGTLYNERNGDKGYLAKEVRKANRYCETYQEHTNKYVKISTYLRGAWNNILWHEDTDQDYMNEILDYNENAARDDCPDSASSLIRQMQSRVKYNPLQGGI